MNDGNGNTLRALLVERYEALRRRLTRRLGSGDAAAEVLHETWLRLGRLSPSQPVARPESYLYRAALNVAADRREQDQRRLNLSEVEMLRHLDDAELDPERVAAARSDIAALSRALAELPPRCRAIFMAVRLDGKSHREVAEHFGLSIRMIERELKRAVDHCMSKLDLAPDVGSGPPEPSK